MFQVFPGHKNIFLTSAYEDFHFPIAGKTSIRTGYRPASNREEQDNKGKMCRLLIIKSAPRPRGYEMKT